MSHVLSVLLSRYWSVPLFLLMGRPRPAPGRHAWQQVLRLLLKQDVSVIVTINKRGSVRIAAGVHLHDLSAVRAVPDPPLAPAPIELRPPLRPRGSRRALPLLVTAEGGASLQSLHQTVHHTFLVSY